MTSPLDVDLPSLVEPFTAAGFPATHYPPSEEQPFNLLRVCLDAGADEPQVFAEVVPVPGLDDLHVLQFLVPLPTEIVPEHAPTLARFLLDLNAESMLNGFGMRADMRLLYFRAMIPQTKDALDAALLVEVLWATAYTVDRFGPLIGPVASGEQSLEEGLAAVRQNLEGPYRPSFG